jgi:hypothetical protein
MQLFFHGLRLTQFGGHCSLATLLKETLVLIIHRILILVSKKTHHISILKLMQLMTFRQKTSYIPRTN